MARRGGARPRARVASATHTHHESGGDAEEAGLSLHEAILDVHHAHESLRRRALDAA